MFDYKQEMVGNFQKLYENLAKVEREYPYIAKWIIYYINAENFGIDCDVMLEPLTKILEHQKLQLSENFEKNVFEGAIIRKQYKNNYFNYKYQIENTKDGAIYRSDTMNSFATTFVEFLRMNLELAPKEDYVLSTNTKFWLFYFCESFEKTNYNKDILEKFNTFASKSHTIGNYLLVPISKIEYRGYKNRKCENSFNVARGSIESIKDYFDLTLIHIQKFYEDNENLFQKEANVNCFENQNLPIKETLLIQKSNMHWLEIYTTFENFIDKNNLNMYVFETNTENGSKKYICKHLFNKLERSHAQPQNIQEMDEFLVTVINNINKRNEEIYRLI